MILIQDIAYISVMFVIIVIFLTILVLNWSLYKSIQRKEPEFIDNNPDLKSSFSTSALKFGVLIAKGEYKEIKDLKLKKRCKIQRIFCIIYKLFFILLLLMFIVLYFLK